ncbi:MAG: hypothetical protein ABR505_12350 [Actinomycetota bacterium]
MSQNRGPLIIGASIVIAAAILAIAFSGGDGGGEPSAAASSSSTHTLSGEFTISGDFQSVSFDSLNGRLGEPCEGEGGYSDISAGVVVAVADRTGTILGSSTLEQGTVTDRSGGGFDASVVCTLTFTVPNLPDSDFYSVEVADRGSLGYTKADLEETDWMVFLNLGD